MGKKKFIDNKKNVTKYMLVPVPIEEQKLEGPTRKLYPVSEQPELSGVPTSTQRDLAASECIRIYDDEVAGPSILVPKPYTDAEDRLLNADVDIAEALDSASENEGELEDDFVNLAGGALKINLLPLEELDMQSDDEFDSDDSDVDAKERKFTYARTTISQRPTMSLSEQRKKRKTKSCLSDLSLTSSVMRRNAGLVNIDEKFDQLFATEYVDEKMGAIDLEEIVGPKEVVSDRVLSEMNNDLLSNFASLVVNDGIDEETVSNNDDDSAVGLKPFCPPSKRELERLTNDELELIKERAFASDEEEKVDVVLPSDDVPKYDCQSILSTYSNLYNRPGVIREKRTYRSSTSSSSETQLSRDQRDDTKGLSWKEVQKLTKATADSWKQLADPVLFEREKRGAEDPAVKKLRKQTVKMLQRERRIEKKNTKNGFSLERSRAIKESKPVTAVL